MLTPNDYSTSRFPTWCPGCGNFGIFAAIRNALIELHLSPAGTVFVYGIGCHGNMHNVLKATNFEGLHGRTLPLATGIKLANHKLPVFVIAGDGDLLGEGGNHLIHTARRNHDLTCILHDNQIYALTTGQTSPTSPRGFKTKSDPNGSLDYPLNPLTLALSAGATFIARGFAGDMPHLTELVKKAYLHKGFSLLDILQPCVTFNHINTYQTYRQNCYKIDDTYDPHDKIRAFEKTLEWEKTGKIPIGIFYEEEKETYEDGLPQIKDVPLIDQPLDKIDLQPLILELT